MYLAVKSLTTQVVKHEKFCLHLIKSVPIQYVTERNIGVGKRVIPTIAVKIVLPSLTWIKIFSKVFGEYLHVSTSANMYV